MADQSIVMKLSLIDTASPELSRVMSVVNELKKAVEGLNTTLGKLDGSFLKVATAADKSNSSLEKSASSLGAIGASSEKTAASIGALESRMSQLVSVLTQFATSAGSASAEIGSVSRAMNGATTAATQFETRLGSLHGTIRGLGEAWAAAKIGKGLEESAKEASTYQDVETRARNMGGPEVQRLVNEAVAKTRKEIPQMGPIELAKEAIDIFAASGHKEDIADLASFAKASYVMRKSDTTGKYGDRSDQNMVKFLEDRNVMQDPVRREAELEMMVKASIGTQGRVGPDQLRSFSSNLKSGLAQSIDLSAMPTIVALIEEAGASKAATLLNALNRTVSGSQIKKELLPNWKSLGAADDNGQIKWYDEFRKNQIKYFQERIMPLLKAKGVDINDDTQLSQAGAKLLGNQTGQEGMFKALARQDQLKKQADVIEGAASKDQAFEEISKTASASFDTLKASLEEFGKTIGTVLLPALTKIAEALNGFINMLNDLAQNPTVAWVMALSAAFVAAGLAISGFASLFGLIPVAAAGATAQAAVSLGALVARAGLIAAAAAASFAAGFVFWESIKNFEAFGTTLDNMSVQFISNLISRWSGFVTNVFGMLSSIYSKAMEVSAAAANAIGLGKAAAFFNNQSTDSKLNQAEREQGNIKSQDIATRMMSESEAKAREFQARNRAAGVKLDMFADTDWDGKKIETKVAPPAGGHSSWLDPSPKGGKGGGSGRGRSPESIESSMEAENARFEKEKLAIELKAIDGLYKDHQVSLEGYFAKKAEVLRADSAMEIAALERQKAVLEKDPAKNADKILKVDHQIIIAQMKEKQGLIDMEAEKRKAVLSLNKEGLTVEEKLQSITKSASTAKIALLDQEYQQKRKIFEINGQMSQAAELDQLHIKEVAKVRYDDEMKQISLVSGVEKTAEMQAQALRKSGNATTAEAAQAIIEAKRKQGEQELAILETLREQAAIIGDPAEIEHIKQMTIAAQELADTLDEGAQKFKDTMQSSIEGALDDLMNGKFSFKKFIDGIVKDINKSVAKSLSESITNGLTGEGGLLSGFMKDGGNFITNLFGGGKNTSSLGGGQNGLAGMFGGIFGPSKAPGAAPGGGEGGGMLDTMFSVKDGTATNGFTAMASQAGDALKNMTKNGVNAATDGLIKQVSQDAIQQSSTQMTTNALQQLAQAAQMASQALQSMGSGGGGGGFNLGGSNSFSSLFGGGGSDMGLTMQGFDPFGSILSFDVGADSIPRDMIAKIHEGEMILPADTAEKVRNGTVGTGGGGDVHQNITFVMPQGGYDKRTQAQIGTHIGQTIQKNMHRNG